MAFLGHDLISDKIISPYDSSNVKQASCDLRLGDEMYIVGEPFPRHLTTEEPFVLLPPGQFAILTTLEKLDVPADVVGLITLRNSYKMQGLVNISGFHVDPTYKGRLKFAVQNVGPTDLRLKYREPLFTIFFAEVRGGTGDGRKPTADGIGVQDVQLLGGSSISLAALKKEVDRINMMLLIYAPFAAGAFVTLLVLLYRLIVND